MGWVEVEERLVSFYDFIEFVKGLGYCIEPVNMGTCDTRKDNSVADNISYVGEHIVGCNDKLCIDCPKYFNRYQINYNKESIIIDINDYNRLKDEIISFIHYKFSEILNKDKARK